MDLAIVNEGVRPERENVVLDPPLNVNRVNVNMSICMEYRSRIKWNLNLEAVCLYLEDDAFIGGSYSLHRHDVQRVSEPHHWMPRLRLLLAGWLKGIFRELRAFFSREDIALALPSQTTDQAPGCQVGTLFQ
ncbi:uncharacterized protein LOC117147102 [Drosophila mauritiana]|uniref:Uncharacterized protein LOC117147102 n=1 Tax=Drosophila mauritiana TaxID=7226 RepID=A0A6P8L166_DROMA|nr:uncharacterized protein LOC117147102 [Drosophila mauritiana]